MASVPARLFGQQMLQELQVLSSDFTAYGPGMQVTTPAGDEQAIPGHITQQREDQEEVHQKQQSHTHEQHDHDLQQDPDFCLWQSRMDRLLQSRPVYNLEARREDGGSQEHYNPGFGKRPSSLVQNNILASSNGSKDATSISLTVNNPGKGWCSGVLKRWNAEKGFGFIQPDEDDEDIVVHMSAMSEAKGIVQEGDVVTFQTQYDERKGKYFAVRLERRERSRSRGYDSASKKRVKIFDEQGASRRLPGLQSLPGLPDIPLNFMFSTS